MAGYSTPAWANGSSPAISAANLTALGEAVEISQHPYGVCSTAAATAGKSVTVDFSGTLSLFTGLTVRVKFTNGNTATSPTLSVNGTTAKSIKRYGTTAATTWGAGQILEFLYDGTNWLIVGFDSYTKPQELSSAAISAVANATGTTPTTPAEALSALAGAVGSGLKCASGTYTGTGTSGSNNKTSITFSFVPKLVIVWHTNSTPNGLQPYGDVAYCWRYSFLWCDGQTKTSVVAGSSGPVTFSVSGKKLQWYSSTNSAVQLNEANVTYNYFAIGV